MCPVPTYLYALAEHGDSATLKRFVDPYVHPPLADHSLSGLQLISQQLGTRNTSGQRQGLVGLGAYHVGRVARARVD